VERDVETVVVTRVCRVVGTPLIVVVATANEFVLVTPFPGEAG
jgi:hypothetical protein